MTDAKSKDTKLTNGHIVRKGYFVVYITSQFP